MSVALSKKLAGLRVGNILMIGSSGTGKTTLMRAVEALSRRPTRRSPPARPWCASTPTCSARRRSGDGRARPCSAGCSSGRASSSGRSAPVEHAAGAAPPRGLVFVDEVDKIRCARRRPAERRRHPGAGGAADPDRERGGAAAAAGLGRRRRGHGRLLAAPVRLRRRLRGALRRRLRPGDDRQGPRRAAAGHRRSRAARCRRSSSSTCATGCATRTSSTTG